MKVRFGRSIDGSYKSVDGAYRTRVRMEDGTEVLARCVEGRKIEEGDEVIVAKCKSQDGDEWAVIHSG